MSGLGPAAIEPILWDTLAASMDRDADRLAEVTRPLFFEGDAADQYAFLSGLLEVVRVMAPGLDTGEFMALQVQPGASEEAVAYGRLLTAHVNGDAASCLALWGAIAESDRIGGRVIATAIAEAGRHLRNKQVAP